MRRRARMRPPVWRALLALTALAAPAAAQVQWKPEDFQKHGFYLEGMGVYAIPTEKNALERDANQRLVADFGPGSSSDVADTFGMNGRAGYRLHPRVGVETQFEWLTDIEIDSRPPGSSRQSTKTTVYTVTGNVKGYLLTGRVQPYLIFGAGWMRSRFDPASGASQRDDGFAYRGGAGIDLYAIPRLALSLETTYVGTSGGVDNLSYVSIGAGFTLRFFPP